MTKLYDGSDSSLGDEVYEPLQQLLTVSQKKD